MDRAYRSLISLLPGLDPSLAGWFDDCLDDSWLQSCDPLAWTDASSFKPLPGVQNIILVMTGCLAPSHQGHVLAMNLARQALLAKGFHVAGSLLVPSHSEYAASKPPFDPIQGTRARIETANILAAPHGISVDPWLSLEMSGDINFTRYFERLLLFLDSCMPGFRWRVASCIGSDRASFAPAVSASGGLSCCVVRDPSDLDSVRLHGSFAESVLPGSFLEIPGGIPASSTALRSQPPPPPKTASPSDTPVYILRRDIPDKSLCLLLRDLIQAAVGDMALVDIADTDEQAALVREAVSGTRAVSLDPAIPGDFDIAISRVFAPGDQKSPLSWDSPPGFPSLLDQIRNIPRGTAAVFDDDICTGGTMETVCRLLSSNGVEPVARVSAADLWMAKNHPGRAVFDIVDARDFFPFGNRSGLLVQTHLGRLRLPYWHPSVSLCSRARLPARSLDSFLKGLSDGCSELGLLELAGLIRRSMGRPARPARAY